MSPSAGRKLKKVTEILKERNHSENLGVDGDIIIRYQGSITEGCGLDSFGSDRERRRAVFNSVINLKFS